MGGSFFIVSALAGRSGIGGMKREFTGILLTGEELLWRVLLGITLVGGFIGLG